MALHVNTEQSEARVFNNHNAFCLRKQVADTILTGHCRMYIVTPDTGASLNVVGAYLYLWGDYDPWKQKAHTHGVSSITIDSLNHQHIMTGSSHTHDFTEDYLPSHKHSLELGQSEQWVNTNDPFTGNTDVYMENTTAGSATKPTANGDTTLATNNATETGDISGTSSSTGSGSSAEFPQNIQIWINGTERTADIGNPNAKAGYDAVNDDWGTGAAFSTGQLNILPYLDLTQEINTIEIRSDGDTTSGKIIGQVFLV